MPAKPDFKKQLEAVYGHELSEEALQAINLVQSIASYTISEGTITQQHFVVAKP